LVDSGDMCLLYKEFFKRHNPFLTPLSLTTSYGLLLCDILYLVKHIF
jgi:hypothetical protein